MKFSDRVENRQSWRPTNANSPTGRKAKIRANSYRDAYDKFLANQGLIQIPVIVFSGIMDTGEVFKDHIWGGTDEAADAKRQEMHVAAAEDAQASLSSTDMLLKELIKSRLKQISG